MSFARNIKKEVLSQEFAIDQAKALISGLVAASGQRFGSRIIVKFNNPEVSSIVKDMLIQLKVNFTSAEENKNWIVIYDYENVSIVKQPSYFFAGAFVGGGSISDTNSNSYHLEIQLYSHAEAERIQKFLNKYSFNFTLIRRRKLFVLYIKKSEQISDFLRAIQAFNSLMAFEDARISRDFHNQLNRYTNLDTYNQNKLAKASKEFKDLYLDIKKNGKLHLFRQPEIDFFELKLKNPYSSLQTLTNLYLDEYGVKKTRAGLNHWLIKLRKLSA